MRKSGLITTEGFRDLLEIREGLKEDRYNLRMDQVEPLAPRYLRVGVDERSRRRAASVRRELDVEGLRRQVEYLKVRGRGFGGDMLSVFVPEPGT